MNLVTFTTSGSLKVCKNLLLNARKFNIEKNFSVYCLDEESFLEIDKFNCKTKLFKIDDIGEGFQEYGRGNFRRVTEAKIQIILRELKDNDSLIYTDCDVAFRKNPTDIIIKSMEQAKRDNIDIIFASDSPSMLICTGFMCVRNTDNVHRLFKEYFRLSQEYGVHKNEHMFDQEIIFQILSTDSNYFNMKWGIYPTEFIKNGHLYWSCSQRTGDEIIVHANFTIGEKNKIDRLKEANVWFIEEKKEII